MKVLKARKKPIIVEVFQWDGTNDFSAINWPKESLDCIEYWGKLQVLNIRTREGHALNVPPGDYICCGVENEMWPIAKSVFEKTYDIIE